MYVHEREREEGRLGQRDKRGHQNSPVMHKPISTSSQLYHSVYLLIHISKMEPESASTSHVIDTAPNLANLTCPHESPPLIIKTECNKFIGQDYPGDVPPQHEHSQK